MKLAISNIAWQIHEESQIADLLQESGVTAVEIAPTKICENPLCASSEEISAYKKFWQLRGIDIVAMQALLFGRPDLTLFESSEKREETLSYLLGIVRLASELGVRSLVFGSPKNRSRGQLNLSQAEAIAVDFFGRVGETAAKLGVVLCIEPNPAIYGCDFVTDSQQGLALVNQVNSPGFGLHLDAAGMTLSEEEIAPAIARCSEKLCHFHISEPQLAPIGSGGVQHSVFAQALAAVNYQGWMSIEMRSSSAESNAEMVKKALKTTLSFYDS